MYALPEYEPPRLPYPHDPEEDDPFWAPDPIPEPCSLVDPPVWDEPGPLRERLFRLICQVLEVLDGRRPIGQLRNVVDPAVYHSMWTRLRQSSPLGRQHRLRGLHTCRPSLDVIELCATVIVSSPNSP